MGRRGFMLLVWMTVAGTGCGGQVLEPRADGSAIDARASAQGHTPDGDLGRLKRPFRMLFVGNSLTAANDLPAMVAGLSRVAGDEPPLEVETVAFGGFSLEDHLAEGSAVRAIERGGWDVVVLQQGPSTLPESRVNLVEYARLFAVRIRASEARPALYGVWPEEARRAFLDAGIASYRAAADSVDGLLFPAGLAWKTAWQKDPAFPLYGPDRFHPSVLGTYLAALVVYAEVRDRSPVGLPNAFDAGGRTVSIPADQARLAQEVAAAVTGTKRRPGKPWAERRAPHADDFVDEPVLEDAR